jgi:hypothetical protein
VIPLLARATNRAASTTLETYAMKLRKTASIPWLLVLPLALVVGGCRYREPWGGCPYEDIAVSPQFMTPWGTVLEQDTVQLMGPHRGTFAWRDGGEVITVPKAGQELDVDATVEIDLTTATMRVYQSTEQTPVCESDYLSVEAMVSFVRLDNGEVELTTPVTVTRDAESPQYLGESEVLPASEFAPGLVPLQHFDSEGVTTWMLWGAEGWLLAEYRYGGQSSDSSTTGHGASKMIVEFATPR